ncbi:MAG TPA: nucleotide exchange factor GrpE [Anaerolineales bacterium]|nr:nucleotide exchange factor GrpE [Anaerolineales bacterium]
MIEPNDDRVSGIPEQDLEIEVETESLAEKVAELQAEIEQLREKSEEYLQGWQRERAEFANFKRRIERERETSQQNITGNIARRYLEVVDDLERALKNHPAQGEGAAWAEGIELIYRKLLSLLEAEGVQPLDAAGQPFDPNLHEAISHEDSPDHDSGQVIEVIKSGYTLGDRVLRPALVRVAR